MNTQVNVIVPDFFALDGLEVLEINVDQKNPKVALVIVGDNLSVNSEFKPTIRYYLAERSNEYYKVIKEIDAYVFNSREEALDFVKNSKGKTFATDQKNQLIFT